MTVGQTVAVSQTPVTVSQTVRHMGCCELDSCCESDNCCESEALDSVTSSCESDSCCESDSSCCESNSCCESESVDSGYQITRLPESKVRLDLLESE